MAKGGSIVYLEQTLSAIQQGDKLSINIKGNPTFIARACWTLLNSTPEALEKFWLIARNQPKE